MAFGLISLALPLFLLILTGFAIKTTGNNQKADQGFFSIQKWDKRFTNSKLFDFINTSFVLVAETGYIALKSLAMSEPKIVNIKDINGFEVITDGKPVVNLGCTAAGSLLFGGAAAIIGRIQNKENITKMSFRFRTNDTNNPNIEMPIIEMNVRKGSFEYQYITGQINEVISTLEAIEKNCKAA